MKTKKQQNFFRVKEDATILQFWQEKRSEINMPEICSLLAGNLSRSKESIRDRLRKYLILLSPEDKEILIKHAEVITKKSDQFFFISVFMDRYFS
jgi:hypothetical protein